MGYYVENFVYIPVFTFIRENDIGCTLDHRVSLFLIILDIDVEIPTVYSMTLHLCCVQYYVDLDLHSSARLLTSAICITININETSRDVPDDIGDREFRDDWTDDRKKRYEIFKSHDGSQGRDSFWPLFFVLFNLENDTNDRYT